MAQQAALRTVLVVDDEPFIRELLCRFMLDLGYQILEAPSGGSALEIAQQRQAPIDLLVTDVVMPGMDGFSLASRVTSCHPETRVLFITGYAADRSDVAKTLRSTPHASLLKPFSSTVLRQQLEHLLLMGEGVQPS